MIPSSAAGRTSRAVAGLTLLALAVRLVGLTRQSIWVDEAVSIVWAGVFDGMHPDKLMLNLQGPLHALLLFVWSRLFGSGELALRSLGALLGTLTVPLLYWALLPLRRPALALLACGLLTVSPYHVWYSQEVRNYVLVILWGVLSLGAFLRLQEAEHRGRGGWIVYTAANVCGLLSNLSHLFLLVGQGAWLLVGGRESRRPLRGAVASWLLTLLLLAPWWIQFYERRVVPSGAFGNTPAERLAELRPGTASSVAGIPYAYFAFATGFSYGPSLRELHRLGRAGLAALRDHVGAIAAALAAFGVTAALGLGWLWRAGRRERVWLLWLVLPVLCTFLAAQLNLKMFNVRYASAAFIPFVVVLAAGILAPRRRAVRVFLLVAVLVPTGWSLAGLQTDPRFWKEDARSAAAELSRAMRPGDLLLFIGNDLPWREYYWRRPPGPPAGITIQRVEAWGWDRVPFDEQVARFEEVARERSLAYALFFRPKDVDPEERWRRYLDARTGVERRLDWPGARLYVFTGGIR